MKKICFLLLLIGPAYLLGQLPDTLDHQGPRAVLGWPGQSTHQHPAYKTGEQYRVIGTRSEDYINSTWEMQDSFEVVFVSPHSDQFSEVLELNWDGFVWEKVERTLYTYSHDATGSTETRTEETFDGLNWQPQNRTRYVQDTLNSLNVFLTEVWENNAWIGNTRSISEYDAEDGQSMSLRQIWDVPSQSWENKTRTLYTHNSDGQRILGQTQQWNNNTQSWRATSEMRYYYLPNGLIDYSEALSISNGQPQLAGRSIYTYDQQDRRIAIVSQSRDTLSQSWVNSSAWSWTYHSSGDYDSFLHKYWLNGSWQNFYQNLYEYDEAGNRILSSRQNWNSTLLQFVDRSREFWYYESYQTTSVSPKLPVLSHSASPNPFGQAVTFTYENPANAAVVLEITDLQGRLINRQQAAPGQTSLRWDGTKQGGNPVAAGTYLYRLRVGARWSSGKVMKQP